MTTTSVINLSTFLFKHFLLTILILEIKFPNIKKNEVQRIKRHLSVIQMSMCEDLCSAGLIRKGVVYLILPLITVDSVEYD